MALPEIAGASLINVEKLSFRDILNPVRDDQEMSPMRLNQKNKSSNISLYTKDVNENYLSTDLTKMNMTLFERNSLNLL